MSDVDFTAFDTAWSRVEYDLDLYRDDEDDSDESPEDKKSELIDSLRALIEAASAAADALASS